MSTPAQEWMEQGIEKGRRAGKAETLLRQARMKFGKLSPSQVARVRDASIVDLDAWLERLMISDSIKDVFGGHNRN